MDVINDITDFYQERSIRQTYIFIYIWIKSQLFKILQSLKKNKLIYIIWDGYILFALNIEYLVLKFFNEIFLFYTSIITNAVTYYVIFLVYNGVYLRHFPHVFGHQFTDRSGSEHMES